MTRNYENCSICGERKRVSHSCPRCGHPRNQHRPQREQRTQDSGQMRKAFLKALAEESSNPRASSRMARKSTRGPARRQEKQEILRSRVSANSQKSTKVTVHRWSRVEEADSIHVSPVSHSAGKSSENESSARKRRLRLVRHQRLRLIQSRTEMTGKSSLVWILAPHAPKLPSGTMFWARCMLFHSASLPTMDTRTFLRLVYTPTLTGALVFKMGRSRSMT